MRGIRSRILRTLQSAAAQSNVLLLSPAGDGARAPTIEKCHRQEHPPSPLAAVPELPTVSDGGDWGGDGDGHKENLSPEANPRKAKKMKVSSGDGTTEAGFCYRRPELESVTLFDPDLLAAFRGVVDAYTQALEKTAKRFAYDEDDDDIAAALEDGAGVDPLAGFETRCPPGGERAVVLYTTSLRGVRKTFEDCATVRRLLDGLRVAFLERDVSMHAPYRDELRALLLGRHGDGAVGDAMPVPPRLFVDGRYVGGADEVVALHEQSRLRPMLRRAARRGAGEAACAVCGGAWFVVCSGCSGRHWLYDGDAAVAANRVPCPGCNENGLVPCPLCS